MTDDHRRLIPADPGPNLSFDKTPHWSCSISFVFQTDLAPITPPPWRRSHPATSTPPPDIMAPSISTNKSLHDLPTPEPESPVRSRKPYKFSTLCATVENPNLKDQYGASSVPIYQTATFKGIAGEYDYTRSGNPTRSHLGQFQLDLASHVLYMGDHRTHETDRLSLCRTPSCENLFRISCIHRLIGHGGPRYHYPPCKTKHFNHCW